MSLIQYFEAWKVSLNVLNSEIILKTHPCLSVILCLPLGDCLPLPPLGVTLPCNDPEPIGGSGGVPGNWSFGMRTPLVVPATTGEDGGAGESWCLPPIR